MRLATIGATLGLVVALSFVGSGLGDGEGEAVERVADRPALPLGSPTPGYLGAEESAIQLATDFEAVEAAPGEPCADDDLRVSWTDPGRQFETGSHYTPVGPRPAGNESANGVVYCEGSDYDYSGFNIRWDGARWTADLAPDFGEGDEGEGGDEPGDTPGADDSPLPVDPSDPELPAPSGPSDLVDHLGATLDEVTGLTDLRLTRPWRGIFDDFPIEGLAPYEPQTTCDPAPKAGTYGFSQLLIDTFTSTGSSGISRACDIGGRSEHKEGRAFDWSALVTDQQDARAASQVIGWLLATDEHGEPYAMARRLGVMYIIYNHSIWRSYAPEQGWVGYTGPNPHTDHVHFSFDHAGGDGLTSFWDVAELPDVSALDFGPYAMLPNAGGVSVDEDQPAVQYGGFPLPGGAGGGHHRPHHPLPLPGGGGDDPGTPSTPTVPDLPGLPAPDLPDLPTPTLPTLPPVTIPPLPGDLDDVVGGLLPACPPGTPLLPLPTHCLLPGRTRP
jgi:hypothetical protein